MWWIVALIVGGVSLLTFAIIKAGQYMGNRVREFEDIYNNEDETNNFIEN